MLPCVCEWVTLNIFKAVYKSQNSTNRNVETGGKTIQQSVLQSSINVRKNWYHVQSILLINSRACSVCVLTLVFSAWKSALWLCRFSSSISIGAGVWVFVALSQQKFPMKVALLPQLWPELVTNWLYSIIALSHLSNLSKGRYSPLHWLHSPVKTLKNTT